ncbi:hypothetical protein NHP190003_07640 [Helicobacter sp. NHP19-003]|uniref:Uncharacterized protein n=1 Tax=Helicobacter gastrocanis TaxID=2849641 RepID=A0ABM7SA72_9HELI|nr:hypothetical protein [Helicobacter sp. NHP19-003]BCZ17482.1 hypothetical protein NHP190003_07640 [Helicobacter sp. NHP19-003]
MLKDYADFLEKDKNEIADHLSELSMPYVLGDIEENLPNVIFASVLGAMGNHGNPKVSTALLFYLLASPIFATHEAKQWSDHLPHDLNDLARLIGKNTYHLNLKFDTLATKAHDFGKLVCFCFDRGGFNVALTNENYVAREIGFVLDDNDKLLKKIGKGLYITRTLKVVKDSQASGTHSLSYLELDL